MRNRRGHLLSPQRNTDIIDNTKDQYTQPDNRLEAPPSGWRQTVKYLGPSVVISAGTSSTNFNVTTLDDAFGEGAEQLTVTISNVSGGGFDAIQVDSGAPSITTTIIPKNDYNNLQLELNIADEELDLDVLIPCGLILCEAITNFQKYAYAISPELEVVFATNDGTHTLRISDKGNGFPEAILKGNHDSLGIDLIYSLAQQINGKARLFNDGGAVVEVVF